MKQLTIVRFWASLTLVLILGGFAPIVLAQSTNEGDGTAAVVVVPPIPGTFVPTKIPITQAEMLEYGNQVVDSIYVIVRRKDGSESNSRVFNHSPAANGTVAEHVAQLLPQVAQELIFGETNLHQIGATGMFRRTVMMFTGVVVTYRPDGKEGHLSPLDVGNAFKTVLLSSITSAFEIPYWHPRGARIEGLHSNGSAVGKNALFLDGGVAVGDFFVRPQVVTGILAYPTNLSNVTGTLSVTNEFFEIDHFELPSGRHTGRTVDRKIEIFPDSDPQKVVVRIYGRSMDQVLLYTGYSMEALDIQVLPNRNIFISPSTGYVEVRVVMYFGESRGFFRAVHYSQEEAQRLLKR